MIVGAIGSPWLSHYKGNLVGCYEPAFLSHTQHTDICPARRGNASALREPEASRLFIKGFTLVFSLIEFAISLPLFFFFNEQASGMQFVEKAAMVPRMGHELLPRHRRHQPAPHPPHDLPHDPLRPRLVEGHREQGEGVLRHVPLPRNGHDRDLVLPRPRFSSTSSGS